MITISTGVRKKKGRGDHCADSGKDRDLGMSKREERTPGKRLNQRVKKKSWRQISCPALESIAISHQKRGGGERCNADKSCPAGALGHERRITIHGELGKKRGKGNQVESTAGEIHESERAYALSLAG